MTFAMSNQVSQSETRRYFIASLAKGLELLNAFSNDSQPLSLKDLSERTGWSKGATFRYAFTLQHLGYLQQDPVTKRYRPGVKVLSLGFSYLSGLGLTERAQSYLEELFQATGQPCHMAILDGPDIVYVLRRADRSLTSINVYVGARLPGYCTSMGKVLLAHLPGAEARRRLASVPLRQHTPNTVTDLDRLAAEWAQIRERGYSSTDEELELGVRSIAAPIRDISGQVIAAVNVSTLAARVSREEMCAQFLPRLLSAATRISSVLGYLPAGQAVAV